MIPDEAVEAVAKILYAGDDEWGKPSWDDAPNNLVWKAAQDDYRQAARELLEAAAPHMMAAAWDERFDEGLSAGRGSRSEPNPYRKAPDGDD